MEKDINILITKELKKRIKKLEDEVIYLRGRLDSLIIPNLNIKKYEYPIGGSADVIPQWNTIIC